MASSAHLNRVFVDFENVPTVDLGLVADKPVEVTLLIGEKQRRLELALVRQIHAQAAKVLLIEVGASGRNALDLVLAWHLGKSAERHPGDAFFVVSRDKDFDPLLAHLRAAGLTVARVDSFAALPFLAPLGRKAAAAKVMVVATKKAERVSTPARGPESTEDERLAKLIDRLERRAKARPVRRKTLLSFINGFHANQLSEPELEAIASALQERGVIAIDDKGRVVYR